MLQGDDLRFLLLRSLNYMIVVWESGPTIIVSFKLVLENKSRYSYVIASWGPIALYWNWHLTNINIWTWLCIVWNIKEFILRNLMFLNNVLMYVLQFRLIYDVLRRGYTISVLYCCIILHWNNIYHISYSCVIHI